MKLENWNHAAWTPWTQPSVPLYLLSTLVPSFAPLRQYAGVGLFTSIIWFENNTATWVFRPPEARFLGQRLVDLLNVPAYRGRFEDDLTSRAIRLETAAESIRSETLTGASLGDLAQAYTALQSAFEDFYVLGAFVEPVQMAIHDLLPELHPKMKQEVMQSFFATERESFTIAQSRSLLVCAEALAVASTGPLVNEVAAAMGSSDPSGASRLEEEARRVRDPLVGVLERHVSSYWWAQNNYERCLDLTVADVLAAVRSYDAIPSEAVRLIRDELAATVAQREALLAEKRRGLVDLPAYSATLVSILDLVGGTLLDQRKRLVLVTMGAMTRLLSALAEGLSRPLRELLFLFPEEMLAYVGAPDRYEERLALRQEALLVYQADYAVVDELAEEAAAPMAGPVIGEGLWAAEQLLERLSHRLALRTVMDGDLDTIRGTCAFADPAMRALDGVASVVRDPLTDEMPDGAVLVASSTTPDFMGHIRRASAIVTDWGGHTSHAAITARELRKPCIIGTAYGSSVIRSGDRLRLDFDAGTVVRLAAVE